MATTLDKPLKTDQKPDEQTSTRSDRRMLWGGLVGLTLGFILAGIVVAVASLVTQPGPTADAPTIAEPHPSVISPEAIRARNQAFSQRVELGENTLSPEAVRARNHADVVQQEILSPERFRVSAPPAGQPQETFSPERYRQWP